MTNDVRKSWRWQRLVAWAKLNLPWVCHLCGQRIPHGAHRFHPLAYQLDHKITVREAPALALSPSNVAPSHRQCNNWRNSRPLTPGLILACTERFAVKPAAALSFFGDDTTVPDHEEGEGGTKVSDLEGHKTGFLGAVSPRSLRAISMDVEPSDGACSEPVTPDSDRQVP